MILDFERPIKDFEERIAELRRLAGPSEELRGEISRLEEALDAARRRIYSNLSPYQRVQVARHPDRPNFRAYRDALADDFYELSGDRFFGDDPAVRGGLARIPVPVISAIIGEGCSGGALAMCATDYVGMLENSYLSVIAPEACASIIFRDPSRAAEAAEALKLTAADMKGRGIVDEIIPEPLGGAHNDPSITIEAIGKALNRVLTGLSDTDPEKLRQARYERYRRIGAHTSENGQAG